MASIAGTWLARLGFRQSSWRMRHAVKPRLFAVLSLAALWLFALLALLQHASPVISSAAPNAVTLPGEVVINEIAWGGTAASSNDEWIELKNNLAFPITLTGWTLTNTSRISVTLVGVIPAHGYFILERSDDNTISDIPADQIYIYALLNPPTPDRLVLRDDTGSVVDTANDDGGPWPAGSVGPNFFSMERIDPLAPDTDGNWASNDGIVRNGHAANGNSINGTPKVRNSATSANLSLVKSGPVASLMNQDITYTLSFSNAGWLNASGVIITDTLPVSVTFLRQSSSYTFTQSPDSRVMTWQVGTLITSNIASSLTFAVRPDAGLTGLITNTASITSAVVDYRPDNNISSLTTQVTPPSADISLGKSAPDTLIAGNEITYVIALVNVGQATALGARVTDTLPLSVTFLRQSAPYAFIQNGRRLIWGVGDLAPSSTPITWTATGRIDLNFDGALVNIVQGSIASAEPVTANNTAQATTQVRAPTPQLLINGVLYEGLQAGQEDEAVQILNVGIAPVNLRGYTVTEAAAPGVQFPTYTLQVHQRVWVAKNAIAFRDSFGFWPDFAVMGAPTHALKLAGNWPGGNLGQSGDVQLKAASGNVLDRLVYGSAALPPSGWSSPALSPYSVAPLGIAGQVIARVPDERTGLPVPDTNTAADWLQFAGNTITGRRPMYAGWDMTYPESNQGGFFWPVTTTTPATVTLGIAPDNAYDVVRAAVRSAQHSIEIEAYELRHYGIVTDLVQKARTGVSVTVLLEGAPAGGMDDQEKWACQQMEAAGGQCWFMFSDGDHIRNRYHYLHGKFIVLDRERLVVSTQNLSGSGMPDDDKSDGTYGSRGYVLTVESPQLAERAGLILDRDRDPAHTDIARWGTSGFVEPSPPVVPITVSGGTTTTVSFPSPQTFNDATYLELFTSPEASTRQSDALIGLLARASAGDQVYVEQMYEYPDWGDAIAAPNLRLKAYLDAARRGAKVRLLLNSGQFDENIVDLTKNITTTAAVNAIARQEGLDLQARMGDPIHFGIHSKLVLVKLNGAGLAYSHVGSINGSEAASKINREAAVQVESQNLYAALARVFWADWNLSAPVFLPLVMRGYTAPDHALVSEVLYDPSGNPDTGREWVELHNPTGSAIDISGWSLGDAINDGEYGAGRYLFPPNTSLPPGSVMVIAQQAADVAFKPDFEFLIDPSRNDSTVPDMMLPPGGIWPGFGLALNNTGDPVILRNAAGQPMDAVVWGTGSFPGTLPHVGVTASDHSLERRPAYIDTDDCAADFLDRTPPTPGSVP